MVKTPAPGPAPLINQETRKITGKTSANTPTAVKPKNGGKKTGSKIRSRESWKCEVFNQESTNDEVKILECEVCDLHYCHNCVKLSDEEYDFFEQPT